MSDGRAAGVDAGIGKVVERNTEGGVENCIQK